MGHYSNLVMSNDDYNKTLKKKLNKKGEEEKYLKQKKKL